MPATATPPAAPAAPKPSGSVTPPSGGEIHISAPPASATEGNPTLDRVDPKSAKGQMFTALRKKAGVAEPPAKGNAPPAAPQPERPGAPNPDIDPESPPGDAPEPGAPDPNAPPPEPEKPGAPGAPAAPEGKGKKPSPWTLVDQFKARAVAAEARALELEKQVIPEAKRKESEERITKYEARIKEMEDDLRYHNAEKYDPDIIKANADYEHAWKEAVTELSEISVIDAATEQPRAVTAHDILALVNMPLGAAREAADAAFGNFADDVMHHRKEIKKLFEAKMTKLEELKKNGAEREKQRREQHERLHGDMSNQLKTFWEQENAAVLANEKVGKFFKPREGDKDWNTRIERGFKFVEEALAGNPADPKLTPDERAKIVRKHVALRNRAAAFDPLRFDYERLQTKLAELEKKLSKYEESTPGAGGSTAPAGAAPVKLGAKDALIAAIRAKAK